MGTGAGTEKPGGGKGVDCFIDLVRDRIGFVSIVIEKMMVKWCFKYSQDRLRHLEGVIV